MLNRYSFPTILGYKGKGEFDAHAAHIAKLRSISRYLHDQGEGRDDDLVIVVDGFDVLAEVPAEEMIQRYFRVMGEKDQYLADKYGMTVADVHDHGIRQTLWWGTDKGCFPPMWDQAHCWVSPPSHLERFRYGIKTDNGELSYSDSKFLNSGTVMGPLGDLRELMDAVLEYIKAVYDEDFKYKNSDQYYISSMYARQEWRRKVEMEGKEPDSKGRQLPKMKDGFSEFHITVDFDMTFTQTQCHNDMFMQKLKYKNSDLSATVTEDYLKDGDRFHRFDIQMPSTLFRSLVHLFNGMSDSDRPSGTAKQWVKSLGMGTNVGTRIIYGFYHNTCSKKKFLYRFKANWYYKYLQPLLRAAVKANLADEPIHPFKIDGRLWKPANHYPTDGSFDDEFGGVFTDRKEEHFIPFQQFCNVTEIFEIGDDPDP